jgi:hypothetical protein
MAVADNARDIAKDVEKSRSPGLYARNKRLKFKWLDRNFHHKIYIKTTPPH